jgi:hypothetical protein
MPSWGPIGAPGGHHILHPNCMSQWYVIVVCHSGMSQWYMTVVLIRHLPDTTPTCRTTSPCSLGN